MDNNNDSNLDIKIVIQLMWPPVSSAIEKPR